ncbi:hypothetical protein QRX60_42545 [Amycolatopsis mongoliensis]|uniref:Uncharacterized protein n=1 Tax=Amycolatopsis mongoliensis TaxID=715475 RepID=A0A9Y2JL87_9PSEU|nr:hypothetical protein [Amycolatopsis sp. 4-36]WIY00671.1 hypothetical protein QRX60_42545 [Amycolatopsis sp. 4-36]
MAGHAAVERDVLVRYLDAWTAKALRSQRGGTYVECGGFAADALRVFGEFSDRLDGHHLELVVVGSAVPEGAPAGLSVRAADDPRDLGITGPVLTHLDGPEAWPLVDAMARGKGHEVVVTAPAGDHHVEHGCAVELVAEDGEARLLVFVTADEKHLVTFKSELWAVDEFAGIRYRDPRDAEGILVDISLTPQLLPLRRALLAELGRRGSCTVAQLQHFTLLETIYRPEDAVGALTSAVTAGEVTRDPEKGRLTPRTVVGLP